MSLRLAVLTAVVGLAIAAPNPNCESLCEGSEPSDACQRGCRFFGYSEAKEGRLMPSDGKPPSEKCSQDCAESYGHDEKSKNACETGCQQRREHSPQGGGIFESFGDDDDFLERSPLFGLFGMPDILRMGPVIRVPLLRKPGEDSKDVGIPESNDPVEVDDAPSFLNHIHDMMRRMLSGSIFGGPEGEGDLGGMPVHHSGGELVVIKSGPGYHEEKTYHLGPDANINKILDESMSDMMERKNPIEKFSELNDIEVFNPDEFLQKVENGDNAIVKASDLAQIDTDPWGFIRGDNGVDREAVVKGDGDRVFFRPYAHDHSDDSATAKLSNWLTGIRMRMGLPTWLMVASVALGVIFTLWLCMVIPSSAPKHKVKRCQMIGTKEAEAEVGISTVLTGTFVHGKADLPPSYDDVANRKEALEPVHKAKVALDADAGPLPEKKVDDLA